MLRLLLLTSLVATLPYVLSQYPPGNTKLPLAFVLKMNTLTSAKQVMKELDMDSNIKNYPIGNTSDTTIERKAVLQPEPAGCLPERTVVPLTQEEESMEIIFPSCTRIERCGGCCSHYLLSCQPVEIEMLYFEVVVTEYIGGDRPTFKGTRVVPLEKHLKCKCDCATKPKDCTELQIYVQSECRCMCTNKDEKLKCENDVSGQRYWDEHTCSCQCLEIKECNTGYLFNQTHCRCELQRSKNKYGIRDKRPQQTINQ